MRRSVASFSASSVLSGMKVWHQASGRPASCTSATKSRQQSGVVAGRLDDDRAADRDRRRDLMHDQVQRMVEGRDRRDDADRLLGGEGPAIDGRRRQPHRDLAAGEVAQLVGGVVHAVDGAGRLDDRVGQRLAALARDLHGEMVALVLQQPREPAQDRDPLMRLEPAVPVAEDALGGSQLGFQRGCVVGRDLGDRRAIEGLHDLQHGDSP